MNNIIPLALRKEQNNSKQIRVQLQINGNKITCLNSKVAQFKQAQKNFAQVLSKPHPPVLLSNVSKAIKGLNQNVTILKSEIKSLQVAQSKLSNQMLISDSKIDKLSTCIKAKKIQQEDQKQSDEIEELSLLSRLNPVSGQKEQSYNLLPQKPEISNIDKKQNFVTPQTIEATVNGTLKLNESQSVQVNIDATNNLNCEVLITATKGTTESLINSQKDTLKKHVEYQGLKVSDLKVQGV